ncbi:MAG: amidohydrolase, partial [Candidatus Nanopelagicaceae bacterium]
MVFTVKSAKSIDFKQIRPDIRDLQSSLVEWRRRVHQKPELAFEEQITSEFIQQKLQEWNIPYQGEIAQTGVVAIIESDCPGKVLAIRADMDAL